LFVGARKNAEHPEIPNRIARVSFHSSVEGRTARAAARRAEHAALDGMTWHRVEIA
jgi:hypothetical protein